MNKKRPFISILSLLIIFSLAGSTALTGQTFDKMKSQIKTKTLPNGMKFIVMERHEAPVVSFHVYADVGSAQESYGITGISHLLEHMAFKGTTTVGTKNLDAELTLFKKMDALYDELTRESRKHRPDMARIEQMKKDMEALRKEAKSYVVNNDFVDMMTQQGDAGINAYTSNDATQYIDSLPSNKLEFWMAMTSDRFLNPVFREFYKERDVVMEERRMAIETQPNGKLYEDFLAAAFKAHPYHHTVVGHMSDLTNITRKDVADYFKKFYSPSNLTVAIVGDVKTKEVFQMAERYFGRISSGPKPEAVRTVEPEQWGKRHIQVEAKSQPLLFVGYHRPPITHQDTAALDAMANIIGQGRSSRIYERLVKKEKIAAMCASFNGFPGNKYNNLVVFIAMPSKDHTSEECLKAIEEEIEKIKEEPVSPQELSKYKLGEKKGLIDAMKGNASMARLLTMNDVVLGGWERVFDDLEETNRVTAEDIQRVARTYLISRHQTVGELVPEEE